MGKTLNFVAALVLIVVGVCVIGKTKAATYVVGGSTGWGVPSNTTFYSRWAASQNFSVGDILTFNFGTGAHDVAVVTEGGYDSCTKTNTISLTSNGPASITLTTAAEYYFVCTISDHCSRGQKFEIDISGSSLSTPSTPASSSASSLAATLFVSLLSISVIGFLFS